MKEFVTVGYSYNELNNAAKEKVKKWYLDDPTRNELFYEDIIIFLKENFPRSDLKVCYSLSYCQGDGLNIYGKLDLFDFLEKWDEIDENKKIMNEYLNNSNYTFTFEKNNHYCYSCKFVDRQYIGDTIDSFCDDLIFNGIKKINSDLIRKFYSDMIDYFENLDEQYKEYGYTYLYECDDDEVAECCEALDWYFTENGEFIG